MADFRKSAQYPEASTKGVTVMAVVYDGKDPEAKRQHVDASILQIDGANEQLPPQQNAHLVASRYEDKQGNTKTRHSTFYSKGQVEAMAEASGDNTRDVKNKDGNVVGKAYVFNADLFTKNGEVLVNTNQLDAAPEDLVIPEDVRKAHVENNIAYNKSLKEKQAQAQEASVETESPEVKSKATPRRNAKGQFVKKESVVKESAGDDEPEF